MKPLSKQDLHKIEIRQKPGSKGAMCGANTEVLIDGEPTKYLTGVNFAVDARGLAKVSLEYIANVVISGVIGEYGVVALPLKQIKKRKRAK